MNQVKFSVVIPTCHRNDLLARCLEKLAPQEQQLPFAQYEVIVTDDGKSSSSREMIEQNFSWVKWVKGPGKGPAANRNNGSKFACGKFLVFTDDDCIPDRQWLLAFKNATSDYPKIKIFEGKTYAQTIKSSFSQTAPINLEGNKLFSCNLCIEKQIFHELKEFDEIFSFSYEDIEFAHRLRILKIDHVFVKYASVCHPWRKLNFNSWKSSFNQSKGIKTFLKKYPEELQQYNSLFFLKELPVSIFRDFFPKMKEYKLRGSFVVIIHSAFYLYMVFLLLVPTVSVYLKKKARVKNRRASHL